MKTFHYQLISFETHPNIHIHWTPDSPSVFSSA